jgi:hypothetical protein
MADLIKFANNLKILSVNIEQVILDTLDEHEVQIKELIHIQLRKGERGDGQLITPQYSPAYAKKKGRTVPDLKIDGSFWDSIFTEIDKEVIKIDSDIRTRKGFELGQHLQLRYTEKILELTPESLNKLRNLILPKIKIKILNEINR